MSSSFSRLDSLWDGRNGVAAVVLLDKDGVVLKPPVREVNVDPLRSRERIRKGFLSVIVDFQEDGDDEGEEGLLLV